MFESREQFYERARAHAQNLWADGLAAQRHDPAVRAVEARKASCGESTNSARPASAYRSATASTGGGKRARTRSRATGSPTAKSAQQRTTSRTMG